MLADKQDHKTQLKTLIGELDERIHGLRIFERAHEINVHCDDLVGQITLAVESAMQNLSKLQDKLIGEVNSYRDALLAADGSSMQTEELVSLLGQVDDGLLEKLERDFEAFRATIADDDAERSQIEAAEELKKRAKLLKRHRRERAFNGDFLRFIEKELVEDDFAVGKLWTSKRDVENDIVIRHFVLDECVSQASAFDLDSSPFAEYRPDRLAAMVFLSDGKVALALKDQPVSVWSLDGNEKVFELASEQDQARLCTTALVQLPNGHLVSGDRNGNVDIWDLQAWKHLCCLRQFDHSILDLKVLPNGDLVAFDEDIHVWDLNTVRESIEPDQSVYDALEEPRFIGTVDFSDYEDEIYDWHLSATRKKSHLVKYHEIYLSEHDQYVNVELGLEILDNGCLAFSFVQAYRVLIMIFDPQDDGRMVKRTELLQDNIESCTVLPSGDVLLCLPGRVVQIYCLEDNRPFQSFRNDDGPIVAVAARNVNSLVLIHLKDAKLPVLRMTMYGEEDDLSSYVDSVSVSSDRRRLGIISCIFKRLVVWPLRD